MNSTPFARREYEKGEVYYRDTVPIHQERGKQKNRRRFFGDEGTVPRPFTVQKGEDIGYVSVGKKKKRRSRKGAGNLHPHLLSMGKVGRTQGSAGASLRVQRSGERNALISKFKKGVKPSWKSTDLSLPSIR